jgi:uncharacterized membrane protein YfcA
MIHWWHYPALFLTSLAAGFVDAVAGGGGLLTLPVLLATGVSAPMALGTNKLQSSFGSASASRVYLRAGAVQWRDCVAGAIWTFIGAGCGALAVQRLDPELLKTIIPFLLAGVLVLILAKPNLGKDERKPLLSVPAFSVLFGLALGFYDGFFGPGTGTFWAMAYVLALGYDLRRATGHTKVMNFASNFSSLLFFMAGGKVYYGIGLLMGAGQFVGGRLGSKMVVARGAGFVRPMLVVVASAITLKLFWARFVAGAR